MAPLAHIRTYVNNTLAQVWANRGNVKTCSAVGLNLRYQAMVKRHQNVYSSVGSMTSKDNNMTDAASPINHLSNRISLSHFRAHSQQSNTWRLYQILSKCRCHLTTMLQINCSAKVFIQQS